MEKLKNYTGTCITLGQLRDFLNKDCEHLHDDTPITLNVIQEDNAVCECTQILADNESVEFYNY